MPPPPLPELFFPFQVVEVSLSGCLSYSFFMHLEVTYVIYMPKTNHKFSSSAAVSFNVLRSKPVVAGVT